jgi:hypothetical protein
MNFFGRTKTRTPAENVRALRELVTKLGTTSGGDTRKRVSPAFQDKCIAILTM